MQDKCKLDRVNDENKRLRKERESACTLNSYFVQLNNGMDRKIDKILNVLLGGAAGLAVTVVTCLFICFINIHNAINFKR